MSNNTPKLRALAFREVRLSKPSQSLTAKATAALAKLDLSEIHKQVDLLHVEAVLVSEGINDNDDAFTHAELKRALSSPILKPMNWQHKDSDILGVMYAVEARDLDGKVLAEIGDEPVELVVQGAIWHHLPHIKVTATEIMKRIEKSNLFVSMECWFDDFDYALYTSAGELFDIIKRNDDTAFLDGNLRVCGGTGRYNGMRIGRALSGINFGGVAFVDRPANKRSLILNSFAFNPLQSTEAVEAKQDGSDRGLDRTVINNVVDVKNHNNMEVRMNDLNRAAASEDQIQKALESALASRDKAAAQERVKAELEAAQKTLAQKETEVAEAKSALETLKAAIDRAFESAKASSAPAEIAKIDQALKVTGPGAGDAVFAAKIAWIEDSRRAAASRPEGVDAKSVEKLTEEKALLQKELASLKNDIRQAEIEHLFGNILEMNAEEVATFVKAGLAQATDEAYTAWLDEKKLFAKKLFEKMGKKGKKEETCASDDAEAGLLSPSDRETPVEDRGAVLRPGLGRVPSDVRRTPRSKLTAAQALDKMFEEVVEPNLAGANAGEVKNESPMKNLVASLLGKQTDNKEAK
jgi:Multidrug resistance efflux pump